MKNLIDEIFSIGYIQKRLGFSEKVEIDLTKFILGGHSFGGLTAISVAHLDSRVKAVFTFDPWVWSKNEEIMDNCVRLTQPQIHIITEGFSPVCERVFGYPTEPSI